MPSSFTWLDYSAQQRRAMLEVVDLFREKGTVDELGLGVIRDTFADQLFPGTSTLHSRARYWLFVPWLYLRLEKEGTSSAKADERARRLQADLVKSLMNGGETEGVIGIEAREKIFRPPSVLYWAGLARHGIRLVQGSIGRYHASLDSFYRTRASRRSEGDETELIDLGRRNWHAGLPSAPADFANQANFKLTHAEAEYLRERFVTSSPDSMLAWGLLHPATLGSAAFPWDHPRIDSAPAGLRRVVEFARRFSILMVGAVLIYNAEVARRAHAVGLRDSSLLDQYRADYEAWVSNRIAPELDALRNWNRAEFWAYVESVAHGRITRTRDFSERWIERALEDPSTAIDDQSVRNLIAIRERQMKGGLARLFNARALERWNGASGLGQLSYRWPEGRTLLQDIGDGLRMQPAPTDA